MQSSKATKRGERALPERQLERRGQQCLLSFHSGSVLCTAWGGKLSTNGYTASPYLNASVRLPQPHRYHAALIPSLPLQCFHLTEKTEGTHQWVLLVFHTVSVLLCVLLPCAALFLMTRPLKRCTEG